MNLSNSFQIQTQLVSMLDADAEREKTILTSESLVGAYDTYSLKKKREKKTGSQNLTLLSH